MELKTFEQLRYYETSLEVPHGIFTRHGGVSQTPFDTLNTGSTVGDTPEAVRENHARMYRALGVNGEMAVTVWQVHGRAVIHAKRPLKTRRWLAQADSMITNRPDMPLVMRFADCTPILFHDPVKKAIGMAHAGWRGTVQGVARATVEAMTAAFGSHPADIRTVIGPSISPNRFQVGEEVVEALRAYFGTVEGLVTRNTDDNTAYVDLWEANKRDLYQAGVHQVEVMGICTYDNTDEFYSHRAEKGKTGRFGAVMSL